MPVCVECLNTKSQQEYEKVVCVQCGKKTDKYREVNTTYRLIDLLLLKEGVFRHYLINKRTSMVELFILVLLHSLTFLITQISQIEIKLLIIKGNPSYSIDMCYTDAYVQASLFILYTAGLILLFKQLDVLLVVRAVLFSSFPNIFKILLVLWEYSQPQYYIILDLINSYSNIVALSTLTNDFRISLSTILLLKLICMLIVVIIKNK